MKIIANFPLADGKALRIEGSSQEEFQAMYKFVTRNVSRSVGLWMYHMLLRLLKRISL